MNRMYVPKRPPKLRRKREDAARLELTLELPRGPQDPTEQIKSESAEQNSDRGIAVVDFYI
jgi:hypothetical protein